MSECRIEVVGGRMPSTDGLECRANTHRDGGGCRPHPPPPIQAGEAPTKRKKQFEEMGKKPNLGFFGMPIARWRFAVSQFKQANCESAIRRLAIQPGPLRVGELPARNSKKNALRVGELPTRNTFDFSSFQLNGTTCLSVSTSPLPLWVA